MAFKTPEERAAMVAKAQARKARREAKIAENATLAGESVLAPDSQDPSKSLKNRPRRVRTAVRRGGKAPRPRKRRKPNARKRAFSELKAACKAFVFARNKALGDGRCEIALACGGAELADTWYHAFPQKGGNGLKYDPRSHFASCSRCNMGEYGARYRGTPEYVNRHRKLLGEELFNELAGLHGRRQITTAEAREMAAKIRRDTEAGKWQ